MRTTGVGPVFSLFGKKKRLAPSVVAGRKLYIPEELYRKMINHCREEVPLEACGLLVGEGGQVVGGYATDNELRSPVVYQVDQRQHTRAYFDARDRGHEVIAIYHSHVRTAPAPSGRDIVGANWPECFYVIVSLAQSQAQVRAWRIVDGQVTEHQVVVQYGRTGPWADLRKAVEAVEPPPGSDIP
jgi:[CysO sulfur-carrier protein]-S-L-cysteine hydrolase